MKKHSLQAPLSEDDRGIVTMLAILTIGAVGIAISISSLLTALSQSQTSITEMESAQARSHANACAEIALNALRENSLYAGNETVLVGSGSCDIRPVLDIGTQTPTIQTVGRKGSVVRKIVMTLNAVTPTIRVNTWEEVADF